MKLLLIRHGDTKLNSAFRFWGQTDVELSADGTRQIEQLRDRLTTCKIDAIYASNLKRALVTAEIIASKHQLDITACAELGEINFGYVEGLTFDEISQQHPKLAENLLNWSIRPEYPGGESLDKFNERVSKFLPRLDKHAPEETIAIIAHSGTLRVLSCNLLGLKLDHWRQMRIALASLSIIETFPQGTALTLLNDVSHLK